MQLDARKERPTRTAMNADPPQQLLTRAELEKLCDTVQPKRMAAWLTARGWVFEPPARRSGFPKVDRAYYLARLSGQQLGTRRAGPRLDFMLEPR